jgi:hypothetical protein
MLLAHRSRQQDGGNFGSDGQAYVEADLTLRRTFFSRLFCLTCCRCCTGDSDLLITIAVSSLVGLLGMLSRLHESLERVANRSSTSTATVIESSESFNRSSHGCSLGSSSCRFVHRSHSCREPPYRPELHYQYLLAYRTKGRGER